MNSNHIISRYAWCSNHLLGWWDVIGCYTARNICFTFVLFYVRCADDFRVGMLCSIIYFLWILCLYHIAADLMLAKSAANLVPFELLLVIWCRLGQCIALCVSLLSSILQSAHIFYQSELWYIFLASYYCLFHRFLKHLCAVCQQMSALISKNLPVFVTCSAFCQLSHFSRSCYLVH